MEQVVSMNNERTNQPGGGHQRRLFYDRCGRYLFLASAALMTLIIFSIIFFVGKQGLLTLADVSPVEFFTSGTWNPTAKSFGALALGATWWQTMIHVVLPSAIPGVMTSIVLAMARAVGETMAVQMLIGNTPQIAAGLFTPTATLTSNIVVEMGNTPFGSTWGNALFLMAFVLLILSLGMILLIRYFTSKKVVA